MRRFIVLVLAASGCSFASAPPTETPAASPDLTCAQGTRPQAGGGACVPVGTTAVPEGFVADDAWGFRAQIPDAPCTGANIALLGSDACQPIDDCAAAFPPKDATIAVRIGAVPYPDRPDFPVVATLSDALSRAASGATIAIDEGSFDAPGAISKPVRIVGRCAERTILTGSDFGVQVKSAINVNVASLTLDGAAHMEVLVDHHATVALDRVYVRNVQNGVEVGNGATVTATRTVFEGPTKAGNPLAATSGVHVIYGGHASLSDVEARGWQVSLVAESVKSELSLSKCIVHGQQKLGAEAEAIAHLGAFLGAHVTIDGSYIESAPGRIALIGAARTDGVTDSTSPGNPPASVEVTRSALVHGTIPREAGSVIDIVDGASLSLDDVTLRHDSFVALGASEGSQVSVKNSVIQGAPSASNARTAMSGLSGSAFTVVSSAILGSTQFAFILDGASTVDISASLVSGNREARVRDVTMFMGSGQAISVGPGAKAKIAGTAFLGNEGASLFVQEGSADIDASVFSGTHASDIGPFAAAITGVDGTIAVYGSTLAKNDRAFALRRGRALLRDSSVLDHKEAMRLEGLTLVQTSDPVANPVDSELVAAKTTFARNAVLVSAKSLTDE